MDWRTSVFRGIFDLGVCIEGKRLYLPVVWIGGLVAVTLKTNDCKSSSISYKRQEFRMATRKEAQIINGIIRYMHDMNTDFRFVFDYQTYLSNPNFNGWHAANAAALEDGELMPISSGANSIEKYLSISPKGSYWLNLGSRMCVAFY